MKTHLCIPTRIRSNNVNSCTNKTKRLVSPMTLLDRFREAVFRLIMLSAVASNKARSHGGGRPCTDTQQYYFPHDDPHHTEAVKDCIEFIKKTASPEDGINRGSSASDSSSVDAAADQDMVIRYRC